MYGCGQPYKLTVYMNVASEPTSRQSIVPQFAPPNCAVELSAILTNPIASPKRFKLVIMRLAHLFGTQVQRFPEHCNGSCARVRLEQTLHSLNSAWSTK